VTGPSLVSPAPVQRGRRARPSQPAQGRARAAQADAGARPGAGPRGPPHL